MANSMLMLKENGQYLWFALLGLGFQPDVAASSIKNSKHLNLGPNMFEKPNKDAFFIVTHFLLEKLNPSRVHEAYRHCWPVLNHKADAEFRKVTCAWLREIMDETANAGSKVVASLFLSPGGPKFLSLMVHLASHVLLQEMKTFTTDGSWVPEVAAVPASTLDIALKRLNLIRKRFLKTAVDQDRFLHSYQKKAQLLVKSIRDDKAEGAKYDELLKSFKSESAQDEASLAEKSKKVRSLWSDITEMMCTIKKEQNAVESVLKGDVDRYILDGEDRVLKIPRCLLERVEQLPHQITSGNMYEAGQLNLHFMMELMNQALQLLKEQYREITPASKPHFCPQLLKEKSQQMVRVLQDLRLIREKISKEEIPIVRSAIRELETDWDRRWMNIVKDASSLSLLNEDPVLGFLSPMAPLSFEPATETTYRSSIFSQYPAKLPDEKPLEGEFKKVASTNNSYIKSPCPTTVKTRESPVPTEASRANTSLDWLFDTPSSPPQKAPQPPPPEVGASFQASMRETTKSNEAPKKTKTQILDLEYENLADQFADAVTTATPSDERVKSLDLECLLNTLQRDPFSTRKQLPRTPESLIIDVKSSWRKAVEEDEASKLCQTSNLNSSLTELLSQPHTAAISTDAPSQTASSDPIISQHSPSACQRGVLLKSTLSWDTFNMEAIDSPSGTGSSAVQFSLDHETLPEMASCDSMNFEDEAVDLRSEEDEELLLPSLQTKSKQSALITNLGRVHQVNNDTSRETECLMADYRLPGLDRDLLMEPVESVGKADKIFSLDLDSLETPSTPKTQEYSLPKLITFSPVDDRKF
ncbi:unnamed protein product [Menidia menidia]|uniref:(Atlantic silverside) hypothetical protein n=1 Tax=Menidia menidia TaxID=238744 RepID=A0A8S4B9S9_9TELE|nr:unnamed protein product [Menidia menidia]